MASGHKARIGRLTVTLYQKGFPLHAKMRRSNALHAVPAFKYDNPHQLNCHTRLSGKRSPWQWVQASTHHAQRVIPLYLIRSRSFLSEVQSSLTAMTIFSIMRSEDFVEHRTSTVPLTLSLPLRRYALAGMDPAS